MVLYISRKCIQNVCAIKFMQKWEKEIHMQCTYIHTYMYKRSCMEMVRLPIYIIFNAKEDAKRMEKNDRHAWTTLLECSLTSRDQGRQVFFFLTKWEYARHECFVRIIVGNCAYYYYYNCCCRRYRCCRRRRRRNELKRKKMYTIVHRVNNNTTDVNHILS